VSTGNLAEGESRSPLGATGAAAPRPVAVAVDSERRPAPGRASATGDRPEVRGKFLFVGAEKIWVKGVTYGAFEPGPDGNEYWRRDTIERDFAQMAEAGFNTVRIPHTVPPVFLLDAAARQGLRVMVGLSAEQYVGYLADPGDAPDVEQIVRDKVRSVAGHPALLCYGLGNEIPASLARWLGRRRIERHLERLHAVVKDEDPLGVVTYVNYPSTEYLHLPFLDVLAFNVYLESRDRLEAYLARLHCLAGDRPVLMSEVGLDAHRNGEDLQAEVVDWQIRTSFALGCAGVFVFSWTDEWFRAGAQVDDWAFGLTRRDRSPKPALAAASTALGSVPFPTDVEWPTVSVVVCSYNGAGTIGQTLEALTSLDYPSYEVIVVDDGSTDSTRAIAQRYDVSIISQANAGLSAARNAGWQAATGEIVAYIDDDAYPDRDWLTYLAWSFTTTDFSAIGGPNVTPPEDPPFSQAVAHAPGGPIHVLVSDREAEHIPGCNMAFRRAALLEIGGFDPSFRAAGDDVDACWRLHERGMKIGFSPAAMVWHHRRSSLRGYWRQQRGYGRAEALLERKWPEKYNALGHVSWGGRVYGNAVLRRLSSRAGRIYHGTWGAAPFQSLSLRAPGPFALLPLMPEWYIFVALLAGLGAVGLVWSPLLVAIPLVILAGLATAAEGLFKAFSVRFGVASRSRLARLRLLTSVLNIVQPMARLSGRLGDGLAPWRRGRTQKFRLPIPARSAVWCEEWREPTLRIAEVEGRIRSAGVVVRRGGQFDRWDLEARGGLFGSARLLFAIEDHGAGTQYVRARTWPVCPSWGLVALTSLALLTVAAFADGATAAAWLLGSAASAVAVGMVREAGGALAACHDAMGSLADASEEHDHMAKIPARGSHA
jgi:GT2 family glycosyltransferase